jgi:hypothetical protein
MMKALVGSAVGGLAAGAVLLLGWGLMRSPVGPAGPAPIVGGPIVQCAPNQEATIQRVIADGREVSALACVDRVAYQVPSYAGQAGYARAAYLAAPYGVALAPQPAYPAPAPTVRRVAARQPVAERVVYVDPREDDVRAEPRRSWAKTAMILGGSAGTGAGVGGIIGGKKGALIGAAIGGGAASIYEASKR